MRADVNLSVREVGSDTFGIRTEMKNLNSFKAIAHAVEGERERQIELLEEGKAVVQETRRWDENKESSRPMRSKEDAKDYRYFPDPDLPPIVVSEELLHEIRSRQPILRKERQRQMQEVYGLTEYDASVLTSSVYMAELFEETAKLSGNGRKTAAWLMGETMRLMKEEGLEAQNLRFSPAHLAALIRAEEEGRVTPHLRKRFLPPCSGRMWTRIGIWRSTVLPLSGMRKLWRRLWTRFWPSASSPWKSTEAERRRYFPSSWGR